MKTLIKVVTLSGAAVIASVALRRRSRRRDVRAGRISATRTVTIRKGHDELYDLWSSPAELPRFLGSVRSIETVDENEQRWTVGAGGDTITLDVDVVGRERGERYACDVAGPAALQIHSVVTFRPAPGERGTEVRFSLGVTGATVASLTRFARVFGALPPQFAQDSLRRFKAFVEAGELPRAERN